MSTFPVRFGRTVANILGRHLLKDQRQLTKNAYLNFLREYKRVHPTYSLRKLLKHGLNIWSSLSNRQRQQYGPKYVRFFVLMYMQSYRRWLRNRKGPNRRYYDRIPIGRHRRFRK